MKTLIRVLLAACAAGMLSSIPAHAATTLRFGHANSPGEIAHDLFAELADRVGKRTNGEVIIRVFPSEQLGKEADLLQQVKSGALDMSAPSLPVLSSLVPGLEIASAPFIWNDWKEAETVIRGPGFEPMFTELSDKHNIIMVSKIWYWGWRNFTFGTKDVVKPEDMAGLKIRVPEAPVWVEMVKALGAAPTPIPFGEVYTALQQKTVDGQENPIPTIFARKFFEVQGFLTMSRHMLQNNTIVISKRSLEKLTPDQRKILIEEAAAVSAINTQQQQGREASMLEDIRKTGKTKIVDQPDRKAFAARMDPVYKNLETRWGADNLKRVRTAIDAGRK